MNPMPKSNKIFIAVGVASALLFMVGSGVFFWNMMGSDSEVEWIYSEPADVYLTKTEVTVGQFLECVGEDSAPVSSWTIRRLMIIAMFGHIERGNYPMNCLTRDESAAICKWLGVGFLPVKSWEQKGPMGKTPCTRGATRTRLVTLLWMKTIQGTGAVLEQHGLCVQSPEETA